MNIGFQVVILGGLLHLQPAIAKDRPSTPNFWTAFECAAYAELMEDQTEFGRLLNSGFNAGVLFLQTAKTNGTRYVDLLSVLPDGVTIRLEGPSVEFALGRVYEYRRQQVWDRVMRQDEYGAWLPVAEWRHTKPEATRTVAGQRFRGLACASLQ